MGRQTFVPKASHPTMASNEDMAFNPVTGQQLDNSRIVLLYGEVSEPSIADAIIKLLHLAGQNHKPIYMVISSYGGSVDDMFSLRDTMKFLPAPVHTIALGKIMSAGVLLLAAGHKGSRMIGRNTRFMIHPISGTVVGNVFEIVNDTKECQRQQIAMVNALLLETKMSPHALEKIMRSGHDFYLDSEKAIELGIADKIIGDEV